MKPFKTLNGAMKRAAFEQAHHSHLKNRYLYKVEKRPDGRFDVKRTIEKVKR